MTTTIREVHEGIVGNSTEETNLHDAILAIPGVTSISNGEIYMTSTIIAYVEDYTTHNSFDYAYYVSQHPAMWQF